MEDPVPTSYRPRFAVVIHIILIGVIVLFTNGQKMRLSMNSTNGTLTVSRRFRCPEPKYCHCNRKERAVTCGKNISYIPEVPLQTRIFTLRYVYLEHINNMTFVNLTNVRLATLALGNIGVMTVSNDAFRQLSFRENSCLYITCNNIGWDELQQIICHLPVYNVTTLKLLRLQMLTIPTGFLECLPNTSITNLTLKAERLEEFSGNIFSPESKLVAFELLSNTLKSVELINLKSLKYLKLRSSRIAKVPRFVDVDGESLFPKLEMLYFDSGKKELSIKPSDFVGLQSLKRLLLKYVNIGKLPDNFLTEMPRLEFLSIQHSYVRDISKHALNSTSLYRLDLSLNSFNFRDLSYWDIFERIPNLKSLLLSHNILAFVTKHQFTKLFSPLKKLENLYVDSTGLAIIPVNLFHILPSLTNLYIFGNPISQWNSTLFSSALHLRKLDLRYNKITIVNETSFPSDFLLRLETLNLQGNPFSCTCDLKWFRNWLNQTNITIVGFQIPALYKCNFPQQWRGKPLLEFTLSEDECTAKNPYILAGILLGVFGVLVTTSTILVAKYKMQIKYFCFLLRTRRKQNRYTKLDGGSDYRYDAFVVYSSDDRAWVLRELLPRVEYQEGYKLSLFDRDFIPGRDILDNVMEHMESSRMVIVVLSDNFAKSEWCKWELTMAEHKLLDERKNILVLIKLDEIRPKHLNNRLMTLMRDKSYIDWSESSLGQDMFWQRLTSALTRPPTPVNT